MYDIVSTIAHTTVIIKKNCNFKVLSNMSHNVYHLISEHGSLEITTPWQEFTMVDSDGHNQKKKVKSANHVYIK